MNPFWTKSVVVFFFLVFVWGGGGFRSCHGRIFSFKMHHRFSEPVKKWSLATGKISPADNLPEKGSFEYYAELADRDRFLRGRKLSEFDAPLSFSDGNSTFKISSLGLYVFLLLRLLFFFFPLCFLFSPIGFSILGSWGFWFLIFFFWDNVVCITRRWSWVLRERCSWWRLILEVTSFGFPVIVADVLLLMAQLFPLYVLCLFSLPYQFW